MTPQLRFPGFIDQWRVKYLGDVAKKISIRNASSSADQLLTNSAVRGVIPQTDYFNKEIAVQGNLSNYYKTEKDDFVYNPRISVTAPVGPFKRNHFGSGAMSPLYNLYRFSEGESLDYFEHYFSTSKWHRYMKSVANYGARSDRMAISAGDILRLPLPYPSSLEQKKIAEFMTLIDKRIEKQTKKIELQKKYKKSIMQKIFTQRIRFNDKNGSLYPDWRSKTLGDICFISTGKLDANAMRVNGEYRFYTCAKEYYKIDKYAFDTEALLISGNGANVGYIHYYNGKFNAYQRTYVLDGFTQNILYAKVYLESYLKKRIFQEKFEGNMPYIVLGTLRDMLIPVPHEEEQQKIANTLSALDDRIKVEEACLVAAKQWKKGLLQRIFV